ncbi:hypothetical protein BC826DRAFT_971997 [Russula brevipes]|nr:hypothetical protein BC826DRAFT_971997 [Russula brevipes]
MSVTSNLYRAGSDTEFVAALLPCTPGPADRRNREGTGNHARLVPSGHDDTVGAEAPRARGDYGLEQNWRHLTPPPHTKLSAKVGKGHMKASEPVWGMRLRGWWREGRAQPLHVKSIPPTVAKWAFRFEKRGRPRRWWRMETTLRQNNRAFTQDGEEEVTKWGDNQATGVSASAPKKVQETTGMCKCIRQIPPRTLVAERPHPRSHQSLWQKVRYYCTESDSCSSQSYFDDGTRNFGTPCGRGAAKGRTLAAGRVHKSKSRSGFRGRSSDKLRWDAGLWGRWKIERNGVELAD